jgi:hypothetical protein
MLHITLGKRFISKYYMAGNETSVFQYDPEQSTQSQLEIFRFSKTEKSVNIKKMKGKNHVDVILILKNYPL